MTKSPYTLAIGGLLAMAAGMGVGRFVYTPILPPMVEALHLTKSQAGLIASANFVGYFAGALLAALRLPGTRRPWLLGALVMNILGLAAMGETTSLTAFLVLRFVGGLASAFILIFSSALVLDRLAREGKSSLSAVHFAGVGSGIAAAAALVACLSDWRTMWLASAALSLVASLAVLVLVPAEPGAGQRAEAQARTSYPRGFLPLALAYGLFGFGYIITATFIVALVRGTREIAALEPFIFVIFGLSAAPSVALWTGLGARWGVRRTFAIAALVEAAGVAGSALWMNAATVIAASLLVGGTFMGLTALGLIGARQGDGDPRGRIALMTASFSFGQILGPAIAGYMYDATGSLAVPSLAAATALVIAAVLGLSTSAQSTSKQG
ncbi:MAG: YbfB/YjiJ family MFS transporter [Alphaproteobacteria bacterium]|nr:YbfB/YjiJ family MFS transporter [Alphaproteobacteria bacterium]